MAWRFNKRIKIIPGVHLNLGKSGISTSIGVKGASINLGKKGAYLNTGIPGTGISNRQKLFGSQQTLPINSSISIGDGYQLHEDYPEVDWTIQPKIKDGGIVTILKGVLIQIIPFGILMVIIQGLTYLKRKDVPIYISSPIKVADRRYKENYRIEGYRVVKTLFYYLRLIKIKSV